MRDKLLSAENMASVGEDTRPKFEEAPSSLKSAVWEHFGFSIEYDDQGNKTVNKQRTVCKHCSASFLYSSGSTSNMAAHLRRNHPTINISGAKRKDTSSSILDRAKNLLFVRAQTI